MCWSVCKYVPLYPLPTSTPQAGKPAVLRATTRFAAGQLLRSALHGPSGQPPAATAATAATATATAVAAAATAAPHQGLPAAAHHAPDQPCHNHASSLLMDPEVEVHLSRQLFMSSLVTNTGEAERAPRIRMYEEGASAGEWGQQHQGGLCACAYCELVTQVPACLPLTTSVFFHLLCPCCFPSVGETLPCACVTVLLGNAPQPSCAAKS